MKHYDLTVPGIERLIQDVEERRQWLERKTRELAARLAEIGCENAQIGFDTAPYDGKRDGTVRVEPRGDGRYAVVAEGGTVLFIEFGAGITYGYGHPEAGANGMGPGTYPDGKGHWDDPDGWYIPKSAGGGHTYGNPPGMPMYNAVKYLEQNLERIAQEVFAGD